MAHTQDNAEREWVSLALCRNQDDKDSFFPEHGNDAGVKAKAVCRRCDVKPQCLQYALGHDERFGIWGGTTPRERRKLQRRVA